jgi:small subunit ribosomal protein S16
MLVIRLRRVGKKNKPTYRIVVAEHSFPVDGKFTADLGFYNPHTKAVGLKKEEAVNWMNKGAQPSNTVARILEKEKVKHGSVVVIKKKKQPKKAIEPKEPKATQNPDSEDTGETVPATEPTTEVVEDTPASEDSSDTQA